MPDQDDDVSEGPALKLLGGAYFHQDYDISSTDEVGVVRDFAVSEGPDDVRRLRQEIKELLARPASEAELEALWTDDCNAYYIPPLWGTTYRAWFERILEILAEYPGGS